MLLGAEAVEPELEVDARLVRGHERWRALRVPGLVVEVVLRPALAVEGLEGRLDAVARDAAEKMVRVDEAKRREGLGEALAGGLAHRVAQEARERVVHRDDDVDERHDGRDGQAQQERDGVVLGPHAREYGRGAAPCTPQEEPIADVDAPERVQGRRERRRELPGEAADRGVGSPDVPRVEQHDAEDEGQIAEEAVVRRRDVHELEPREHDECDEPRRPRAEDEERYQELEGERRAALQGMKPERRVMRVPGEARRDGRGLVVVSHRAAVLPVAQIRLVLRDAGLEVELEKKELQHEERPRRASPRRQEHSEEPALEQEIVPLERQEGAPEDRVREIEDGRRRERDARQDATDDRDPQRQAGKDAGVQRAVARAPAEHGWHVEEPELRVRRERSDQVVRRKQAAAPHEDVELQAERRPRDHEHHAEPSLDQARHWVGAARARARHGLTSPRERRLPGAAAQTETAPAAPAGRRARRARAGGSRPSPR